MIDGALGRILRCGPGFNQERPIAGLSEYEFTRELLEHAVSAWAALVCIPTRGFTHLLCRNMQLWINPRVARIQPNFKITVLAPCCSCWLNDLLRRIGRQSLARRGEHEIS